MLHQLSLSLDISLGFHSDLFLSFSPRPEICRVENIGNRGRPGRVDLNFYPGLYYMKHEAGLLLDDESLHASAFPRGRRGFQSEHGSLVEKGSVERILFLPSGSCGK